MFPLSIPYQPEPKALLTDLGFHLNIGEKRRRTLHLLPLASAPTCIAKGLCCTAFPRVHFILRQICIKKF